MEYKIWISKTLTCQRSNKVLFIKNEVYETSKTYFLKYFMNSNMFLLNMYKLIHDIIKTQILNEIYHTKIYFYFKKIKK